MASECSGFAVAVAVIHRREDLSEGDFQSQLEAARAQVLRLGTHDVPGRRGPASTWPSGSRRMGRAISDSLRLPVCATDEQSAEQAIRFVVIDRLITQGPGASEATLVRTDLDGAGDVHQQGRSVFAYLEAAVSAWFQGDESPSLLPRES